MSTRNALSIGRIVRYTDPDGNHHDAIVAGLLDMLIRIRYRRKGDIAARYAYVDPESLSIPQ